MISVIGGISTKNQEDYHMALTALWCKWSIVIRTLTKYCRNRMYSHQKAVLI